MGAEYKRAKSAKPCYVCGCEDIYSQRDDKSGYAYRMFCTNCGACTNWKESREVALNNWNGHAIDTFHAEKVLADFKEYNRTHRYWK